MRKSCLSILLIIIYSYSFSQSKSFDIHKKYSVVQIFQDIDYTEKYLTKFHPDPFKYISQDSLHAFILSLKSRIDSPLTEMQIRFYIKQIIAKIGCGHTDAGASKHYAKTIAKTNRPIIPLNTFITDSNHLYILNNLSKDSSIKAGDEILSINNHSTQSILHTIFSVSTSDGYNTTYKKQGARYQWFKYYYSFCYGFKSSYNISIKHKNQTITNYNLPSISSLKDTIIFPKKDSVHYINTTKTCHYSILQNNKPIAIIDIDGFKGRHWYSFFRKTFRDIKRKNIEHLVIDLRDNGGGQINDGLNVLSYLIHKKTYLPFDRKPNLMMLNPKYKMNIGSRITPFIFCTMMPQWPKNKRLRHYFIALPKRKNAYHGNIYVLVNGKSFSMSGVVASYLKYQAHAIIIGEETGGNVAGSNAVISGKIILPNTRIQVFIPMYHIYHDIKIKNEGHGLIPDYPTQYSKDDILNGVDIDLIKVSSLVN